MKRALLIPLLAFWPCAAWSAPSPSPTPASPEDHSATSPFEQINILARAIQLIRQDYVDESQTGYKDLTYAALRGLLSHLDPHSQFMEPSDFQDMQEDTKSEFGGLGLVVALQDGMLTVVNPMEDSPAFDAGLLPGDQILKIDGRTTDSLSLQEAVDLLRGNAGESVTLTVNRPSTAAITDYDLVRRIIKVPSVKEICILPPRASGDQKIGYVRITQFNEPTAKELSEAIDKLESQGAQALILDLRYNPGGLLGSAVDVAGQFLPPNTLVVSTEGRSTDREYRSVSQKGATRKMPLVVLVNNASASGSEIVAGALKDLNRALIIGETTFGKGSVQSVISLPDGSAVRLTTAHYFTPNKNLIHEHGVEPHIRSVLTPAEEKALLRSRRVKNGEPERKSPAWDPQLERAADALQGVLRTQELAKK